MNLIDNVYFITPFCGSVSHLFPDLPDIVHAIIGSSVDLDHIHGSSFLDRPACPALVAGTPVHRVFTVDRPCQYFCNGGLTCAPGTAEKICMSDSISFYLIFQCCYYMFLFFYVFKILRADLTVKSSIAHGDSPLSYARRNSRKSVPDADADTFCIFYQLILRRNHL